MFDAYVPGSIRIKVCVEVTSEIAWVTEHGVACAQLAVSPPVGDAYKTVAGSTQEPASTSHTWLAQSLSSTHPLHVCDCGSHTGVSPLHCVESTQATQMLSDVQIGVAALHCDESMHCTHVLFAVQIGAAEPQSADWTHCTQTLSGVHTGIEPAHCVESRQPTHV